MTNFDKWKENLKAEHFLTHDFASFCDMFTCANCPVKNFQNCLNVNDDKEKALKADFMAWAAHEDTDVWF